MLSGTPPISCAKFYIRSHHAVIRVDNAAGHVIETVRARVRLQRVETLFVGLASSIVGLSYD
jgi:hypothetical protein